MKLYVVSNRYLPLVKVAYSRSELTCSQLWASKLVVMKHIHKADLNTVFNLSKGSSLIACESKKEAIQVMSCLLQGHNTTPDFIQPGIGNYFAVPVIYTIDLDENNPPIPSQLTANDLVHYVPDAAEDIPAYGLSPLGDWAISFITDKIKAFGQPIYIRKLNGLELSQVSEASYLDAGMALKEVDLNPSPKMCCLM